MPDDGSPRILISRLSHIGDCILTLPVLCALRARYPQAYIGWVVERPSDQLLKNHAALDELFVLRRGWLKSPAGVLALRRNLRVRRFDVVIDPQCLTKSAAPGWLSGARRRIGLARPGGRELSVWLNNELVPTTRPHIVDRSLELLAPLGIEAHEVEFNLPLSMEAGRAAAEFIRDAHLGEGYAVLNPGAGWKSKLWPAERFGQVAKHLGARLSLPSVVVWAGNAERQMAERIVARSGGHALLAPPTTLVELAAYLRQARLFVGSDTGPLHLAAAVGTPCVGLYGPTRPEDCGPYGAGHVCVQEFYQAGTSRARRSAENVAMQAISAETVCGACEGVLELARTQRDAA
jgi:heptosyltransferase-1